MAFDRQAAKAEGYTDDEIDAYLQAESAKKQGSATISIDDLPAPTTNITPVDKTAEAVATTAGGLTQAVPYALGAYGTYKAGQIAKDALGRVLGGGGTPSSGAVAPRVEPKLGNLQPARAPVPTGGNVIQFPGTPAQAAQAVENPSLMGRAAQLYKTYAPAFGEAAGTLGRMASRAAGPASLMMYSGGLNQGEDQAMARIRAIQDSISKMPKEQQTMYFNLPMNKRQQVDQMIITGSNPSALLTPNAINSGFTQELTNLRR